MPDYFPKKLQQFILPLTIYETSVSWVCVFSTNDAGPFQKDSLYCSFIFKVHKTLIPFFTGVPNSLAYCQLQYGSVHLPQFLGENLSQGWRHLVSASGKIMVSMWWSQLVLSPLLRYVPEMGRDCVGKITSFRVIRPWSPGFESYSASCWLCVFINMWVTNKCRVPGTTPGAWVTKNKAWHCTKRFT